MTNQFSFAALARFALTPPPSDAWALWQEALSAPEYPPFDTAYPAHGIDHVVLVSGGQDSTVAYRIAQQGGKQVLPVYVDFAEKYQKAELHVLAALGIPYSYHSCDVGYAQRDPRWAHIMPARNLLALEIAARAGGKGATLWLGVVAGEYPERGGDKSAKFLELATRVFAQMYGTREIRTLSDRTKAEWAYWWRTTQPDANTLLGTVTCYAAADRHCGRCQACLRRYCALALAGYPLEDVLASYAQSPLSGASTALKKYRQAYRLEMLTPGATKYGSRRAWQDLTVLDPEFLVQQGFGLWTW